MTLVTGSGLERFMNCRASSVLHRAFDERGNEWAQRGIAAHEYLQSVSGLLAGDPKLSPEAAAAVALELVDVQFRDGCRAIDVSDLRDVVGLTAEMAFAYNPMEGTSRVLGVGIDRQYSAAGVTEDEIPLSLDVVGLDDPKSPSIGFIADYKSGWSKRTPAAKNWQLRGGALALARHYDLDIVRVQLIHLHEDRPAYRDRASFDAADLAMFEAEARAQWKIALADRELGELPDCTQGSWCNFCPSYHSCPAKTALIRAVISDDIETRLSGLTDEELALAFKKMKSAKQTLDRIDSAMHAIAAQRPILLERRADGTEEWFGMTTVVGNLKIDGPKARDVVREMLDEKAVDEVSKFSVTQKLLKEAIKARVPYGQAESKLRAVIDEMKKRGAATKPTKHDVDIYTLKPAGAQLKAG